MIRLDTTSEQSIFNMLREHNALNGQQIKQVTDLVVIMLRYHISVKMILKQLPSKEDTLQIMQKTQSLVSNTDSLDYH